MSETLPITDGQKPSKQRLTLESKKQELESVFSEAAKSFLNYNIRLEEDAQQSVTSFLISWIRLGESPFIRLLGGSIRCSAVVC